jgi:hypothetical protein
MNKFSLKVVGATLFTLLPVILFFSCATIFSGNNDEVVINSEPKNAEVYVNGTFRGKTPMKIDLKRGKSHHIEIKVKDYESYIITTDKSFNGLVIGNILCGGLIGLIIDFASGCAWNVDPNIIVAKLKKVVTHIEYKGSEPEIINVLDRYGNSIGTVQIEWQ